MPSKNDILEQNLNYIFKDKNLLRHALTHKSCKKDYNNERLEFLGDAVLALVVGEFLFDKFKKNAEGDLTKLRAALVSEKSFAKLANSINLGDFILMSEAEEKNGGKKKPSILSDAFEAVFGAMFLDTGFEKTKIIAKKLIELNYPKIDAKNLLRDYKTKLQELTQGVMGQTPVYELLRSFGPDHLKQFEIALKLDGKEMARAIAGSKKEAQQMAAKLTLEKLKEK
ncbi:MULTISPECIES: ribonuclease III [unclassified Campylobacter]|uniref:ribonuclease III n=1 Tax=unclassified Campylobacter TaxID=2593542 RepID=UPI001237B943|nr:MULTISPECIES: ribonuclease III [unclassified Campylobacter]KAA6227226.1 ribonuclease III [Campylobacter sp. LR286c]KAA6227900.1 ribonuclease III [Campylobacter sp. LR185c]KAA6228309.1 ribonuclease III [Campylobacter sp. LR196d]KAA6229310.1 ribonuclease III [Campylobacter sp. LR291e]KAA8604412.1 ribonuclease III [Campylobacter sp. LR185c]